jgi:hypothetical protein
LVDLQPATPDELTVRLATKPPQPEAVLLPVVNGLLDAFPDHLFRKGLAVW